MKSFGAQQAHRRVSTVDASEIRESFLALSVNGRQAGQLQVAVGMRRTDSYEPFEVHAGFLRPLA